LNSTVVRARNLGDAAAAREAEINYATGNQIFTVRAKNCILACWNMVIPYLVPELPEKQKRSLHYLVTVPLVYTSVGIRNWTSFHKLGIRSVRAPGAYWMDVAL